MILFSDCIRRNESPIPMGTLCAGAYLLHCCESGEFPTYRGAVKADCHMKAGDLIHFVRDARDLHWVIEGHMRGEPLKATPEGIEELTAIKALWVQAQRPFWWGVKRGYCPQPVFAKNAP